MKIIKVEFVICFPSHTWEQHVHEVSLKSDLSHDSLIDWANNNLQSVYPTAVCFGIYHIFNNESI